MPTKKPYRVVVLASTRGTTFGALLAEYAKNKMKGTELVALVSDKADSGAVERAEIADIPTVTLERSSPAYHEDLLRMVQELRPDLICCMGYMRILKAEFCEAFHGRILNVHPSLLPKFGGLMGLAVHQAVIDAGEGESGMTIHLVTPEVDAGPVILQKQVEVAVGETAESLAEKVQALERQWYPEVIRWFAAGKIVIGK